MNWNTLLATVVALAVLGVVGALGALHVLTGTEVLGVVSFVTGGGVASGAHAIATTVSGSGSTGTVATTNTNPRQQA